jgi:hypothetical protein
MKKKIHSVEMVGQSLMELQAALIEVYGAAQAASIEKQDSCIIDIENQDGEELASVDLIEETLTDGSKVYNIELRFSNVE